MPTPAKKAASSSLTDLLGKKDNDKAFPDKDKDSTFDKDAVGHHAVVEEAGSEVVEVSKPEEQNPDGVTFSGNANVINKTPAELAAETPEESKRRFNINDEVPDEVHNNPNIQVRQDEGVFQIPGGTHLHPDVAKDNYNRSVGGAPSESGLVTRTVTEHVYATEAEQDDKGRKDLNVNDPNYNEDALDSNENDGIVKGDLDRSDKYNKDGTLKSNWKSDDDKNVPPNAGSFS